MSSTDDKTVEAVARAIFSGPATRWTDEQWDESWLEESTREVWREYARAAIEAHEAAKGEALAAAWERGRKDWSRYVGRCEDADAAGQGVMIPEPANPFGESSRQEFPDTSTVVDAVRYFAESWRFKGKGEPDDMPNEHEEALGWCASTLFAMLGRLGDDAPLGLACKDTGWIITAAVCPDCKGSGRADGMKGAQECLPCGGCGHVCDESARRTPATSATVSAEQVEAGARAIWESGAPPEDSGPWASASEDDREDFRRDFRAGLRAAGLLVAEDGA